MNEYFIGMNEIGTGYSQHTTNGITEKCPCGLELFHGCKFIIMKITAIVQIIMKVKKTKRENMYRLGNKGINYRGMEQSL